MPGAQVDMQLKEAFASMQAKAAETRRQAAVTEKFIEAQRAATKRALLAKEELGRLPAGATTFRTVGRMFVQQTVEESLSDFDVEIAEAQKKIEKANAQKEYLERSLKEAQENLRELVNQRRSQS